MWIWTNLRMWFPSHVYRDHLMLSLYFNLDFYSPNWNFQKLSGISKNWVEFYVYGLCGSCCESQRGNDRQLVGTCVLSVSIPSFSFWLIDIDPALFFLLWEPLSGPGPLYPFCPDDVWDGAVQWAIISYFYPDFQMWIWTAWISLLGVQINILSYYFESTIPLKETDS
jgi:hypothetical protein